MCGPYWSQWDKSELDSWQIKDQVEEEGCSCGYFCFDCLGMSWDDFM